MSYVDLAMLSLHRRSEMEARIKVFGDKCDHAVQDIIKLKAHAQTLVLQLNCDPSELKERFLSCIKQLEEYTYLITDFNICLAKLELTDNIEHTPVQDTSLILQPRPSMHTYNIMDMLTEPAPSTSTACSNRCPREKTKKQRVPKEEQLLIQFSSASCSTESMPISKSNRTLSYGHASGGDNMVEKKEQEVQCELTDGTITTLPDNTTALLDPCNLPAQDVLQPDQMYPAVIMNIDGASFWVIIGDTRELHRLILEMTEYYDQHRVKMTLDEVNSLTYCAFYDEQGDCYYRGLFIRLTEEEPDVAEVFLMDTGEVRAGCALGCLQPLAPRFFAKPPYARCCHLAGVDLMSFYNNDMMEKQEQFMRQYLGIHCSIEVDDNASESLGVFVVLPGVGILNDILVEKKLAFPIAVPADEPGAPAAGPPRSVDSSSDNGLDLANCPEYEDPVEAVMGYSCRDDADICKHYKGGPEKTCFKGTRCTKKHILKHPDGWTLDRVEVSAKCPSVPLPAPGTWHRAYVTTICHFDRLFVQLVAEKEKEPEPPVFGVVVPPASLEALVRDMNSPAAQVAYKPLKIAPAPGEIVAARYPMDGRWYRARVLSTTRADQCVEVMFVDYGNVMWVREDAVREVDARHLSLPAQAVRCVLAGVLALGHNSAQWAEAKRVLTAMAQDRTLDLRVIARDYDEMTVELFDAEGYSVAEQMAAQKLVRFTEYRVVDDSRASRRLVVP